MDSYRGGGMSATKSHYDGYPSGLPDEYPDDLIPITPPNFADLWGTTIPFVTKANAVYDDAGNDDLVRIRDGGAEEGDLQSLLPHNGQAAVAADPNRLGAADRRDRSGTRRSGNSKSAQPHHTTKRTRERREYDGYPSPPASHYPDSLRSPNASVHSYDDTGYPTPPQTVRTGSSRHLLPTIIPARTSSLVNAENRKHSRSRTSGKNDIPLSVVVPSDDLHHIPPQTIMITPPPPAGSHSKSKKSKSKSYQPSSKRNTSDVIPLTIPENGYPVAEDTVVMPPPLPRSRAKDSRSKPSKPLDIRTHLTPSAETSSGPAEPWSFNKRSRTRERRYPSYPVVPAAPSTFPPAAFPLPQAHLPVVQPRLPGVGAPLPTPSSVFVPPAPSPIVVPSQPSPVVVPPPSTILVPTAPAPVVLSRPPSPIVVPRPPSLVAVPPPLSPVLVPPPSSPQIIMVPRPPSPTVVPRPPSPGIIPPLPPGVIPAPLSAGAIMIPPQPFNGAPAIMPPHRSDSPPYNGLFPVANPDEPLFYKNKFERYYPQTAYVPEKDFSTTSKPSGWKGFLRTISNAARSTGRR